MVVEFLGPVGVPNVAPALGAAVAIGFTGRTEHSTPFQLDIPFDGAVKTTIDPGNIWSWHHEFVNAPNGQLQTVDVLVDVDGNQVMDTEHSWLRVMITDLELVSAQNQQAVAWILDSVGKRYAVGTGGYQAAGPVEHVSLTTPIVLPVGSILQVALRPMGSGSNQTVEVYLVGRIVNI